MDKKKKNTDSRQNNFPPVISVLGHVDHGKTSLLDAIRKTSIAAREHGGITQRIGASQIEIDHEGKRRKITFIDTPGHEAFANMRSQGVNVSDVALLIIAGDDGIMPQTRESISKILEAKMPFIVVFTKIDLEGVNIERVKQQVIKEGILLEGLGGDVPFIGVSSKTGERVKDLLDLIILVYDFAGIEKSEKKELTGVIIDSKIDKRRGIAVSLVIKQGILSVGQKIYTHGKEAGKVRAIIDASGKNAKSSAPGDAVEILGLSEVLPSGSVIFDREMEMTVKPSLEPALPKTLDLAEFFGEDKSGTVAIVLKTDTVAELEAVKEALPKNVRLVYEGTGEVGLSDVLLAKDFKALIIAFNVDISKEAKQIAENDKIFYKSYGIIYELLGEINDLIDAIKAGAMEKSVGRGVVLQSFQGTTGVILGVRVDEGRLAVHDRIKIKRGEKTLGESEIVSLRKGKEDARDIPKNTECGVVLAQNIDFVPGDAIIAYSKKR